MVYGLVCFRFSLVRLGYSLCLLLGGVAGCLHWIRLNLFVCLAYCLVW